MRFTLSKSQRHSLQPLMVMAVIILLPLVLTTHIGSSPVLNDLFPSLDANHAKIVQGLMSISLIGIGILVWRFGSKKAVLRVIITYAVLSTIALGTSILYLVLNLQSYGPAQAVLLMKDAFIVWSMTALTFSLWYWLIDSGWAESMGMHDTVRADFLFPQQVNELKGWQNWTPSYVEYVSLAFNTNTAFSPTDVSPLSHRAKVLMMAQSSLALIVVGTVVARAINILAS
jgi:hypothetical protein